MLTVLNSQRTTPTASDFNTYFISKNKKTKKKKGTETVQVREEISRECRMLKLLNHAESVYGSGQDKLSLVCNRFATRFKPASRKLEGAKVVSCCHIYRTEMHNSYITTRIITIIIIIHNYFYPGPENVNTVKILKALT
jgi:hypothetical protein